MVRSEWPLLTPSDPLDCMSNFAQKLRLLKRKVRVWIREKTMEKWERSLLIEEEIRGLLDSSFSGILCARDSSRLQALKIELQSWRDHEIQSTRLQSRLVWASQGDANTKFFHEVAFARKNHNAIWGLKVEEGILITDELGIKELGVHHFRNIFRDDLMTNIEAQLKVVSLFPL